jgi:hypothetical protein
LLVEDWVSWAGRVTVRRLREDVERRSPSRRRTPRLFAAVAAVRPRCVATGKSVRRLRARKRGVAGDDREIGAPPTGTEEGVARDERGVGALRGVNAGLLWCAGTAPDGLRWEMGIRPGVTPLLSFK